MREQAAHSTGTSATPSHGLADQIAELSAITGGLAHELRNPLSTLKVNLQLLDEDWRDLEAAAPGADAHEVARRSRKRIGALLEEARRLERILGDFLKYVGRRELHPAPHDVNAVIAELGDFFRPQAELHRIELRIAPAPGPLVCLVDVHLLKQALLNLLLNAQEAMPDGGVIELAARPEGTDRARIEVRDNGPGIPEDRRGRIFEAYFSTKKAGSGLGLAMARQIVRQHGGDIRAESNSPGGACFVMVLPRTS